MGEWIRQRLGDRGDIRQGNFQFALGRSALEEFDGGFFEHHPPSIGFRGHQVHQFAQRLEVPVFGGDG
ncbi:MAG: hypothetical protein QNK37_34420 [Acidobacteriota bacterium]|nr:hypothetical protein [Acidobacteriota bacterium]